MDKKLADKWVAALRSGEHRQGRAVLHNASDDSKCCLGVICIVAGIVPTIENDADDYSYCGSMSTLSSTARDILGIKTSTGELVLTPKEKLYLFGKYDRIEFMERPYFSLSDLNDGGVDFFDIADIIENHWEEL